MSYEAGLILGLETSGDSAGCAIGTPEGILASESISQPKQHGENLAPMISRAARTAGIGLQELDLIAVDIGPGLYTGLRVGVAMGMSLAFALELQVLGISSLDIVAFQAPQQPQITAVVLDARRSEVFYKIFNKDSTQSESEGVCAPRDLVPKLEELAGGQPNQSHVLCLGDGASLYSDIYESAGFNVLNDSPKVESLIQLAAVTDPRDYLSAYQLQPLYKREPDAKKLTAK